MRRQTTLRERALERQQKCALEGIHMPNRRPPLKKGDRCKFHHTMKWHDLYGKTFIVRYIISYGRQTKLTPVTVSYLDENGKRTLIHTKRHLLWKCPATNEKKKANKQSFSTYNIVAEVNKIRC